MEGGHTASPRCHDYISSAVTVSAVKCGSWLRIVIFMFWRCISILIRPELTGNLIRFSVRVFITQIADHAQQQPAREQYQPALAWSGLSPPPADDGGRQSCDIHPSLSSLNTLPSMWQRRITSHSHQLECSRHPFINIQHTIFIKFQTFGKILNIISSSDGLFENSKYDIRSLLSVNCMSQPVQLKGCPVLLKFTSLTQPVLLTRLRTDLSRSNYDFFNCSLDIYQKISQCRNFIW